MTDSAPAPGGRRRTVRVPAPAPLCAPAAALHPASAATSASAPVVVASDLDRTLIYSAAALALDVPDALAPRLLCVELYQGQPLSFLTETAAALLTDLARTALLVPATTRTREQYRRVHLPGPAPRFAVCANGGHLLVDGVTDPDWRRTVAARLEAASVPLAEVREHLVRTADPEWLRKERTAEDLFAYLVVDRDRLPASWVEDLTHWAAERGWTVSLQGRKLYAVPAPLTKSAAVAEVVARTGATHLLAAGDSLLDADLLLAADTAWRPGHGELAEAAWAAPHVVPLQQRGITAGEALARALLRAARALADPHSTTDPHSPAEPGAAADARTEADLAADAEG